MLENVYSNFPIIARVVFGLLALFLGAGAGSFLGVLVERVPRKENWVNSRSHCNNCKHKLGFIDLIPLVSALFTGFRCRYCNCRFPKELFYFELVSGLSFAFLAVFARSFTEMGIGFLLFSLLLCASFFDIKTGYIPDFCSFAIATIGLVLFIGNFISPSFFDNKLWSERLIFTGIIGGVFLILSFLGAMGLGDTLLMGSSAFLLGLDIIPATAIGVIIGAVYGIYSKKTGKCEVELIDGKEHASIRFGPCLSIGIAVSYLFGAEIIAWYTSFFISSEEVIFWIINY